MAKAQLRAVVVGDKRKLCIMFILIKINPDGYINNSTNKLHGKKIKIKQWNYQYKE